MRERFTALSIWCAGAELWLRRLVSTVRFIRLGFNPATRSGEWIGRRVYSVADLDEALKADPANTPVAVGIISRGEQVERPGLLLSAAQQPSPSGIDGSERNHRFRASGWTRHYQTFAEMLQMIALLALGLALAHLRNHGANKYFRVAIAAASLLTLGLVFTAMRTVIVAFAIGASVIAWRSLRGVYKVVFTFALFFVLAFGAVVVWQTRDRDSLVAWRSEFIVAFAGCACRSFAHSDSSDLWAWHGRDETALERVGLSRQRHASPAFDSAATGLRSRIADAGALAVDDDRCSG